MKKIHITSIRWSRHGTNGETPDPDVEYAGMVMYDPGTFVWEDSNVPSAEAMGADLRNEIKPGQAYGVIMPIKDLTYKKNEA